MKRLKLPILLLTIAMLTLAGCSKEPKLKDVYDDEPHIRGVIKQVDEDTILMESRERIYSGDIRVSKRTRSSDEEFDFAVGDKITVYYDGKIAESDPAQINKVYAFKMESKAEAVGEEAEEAEVDEDKLGFDDEDYYSMPILTVVEGDKSTEMTPEQSAFIHDLMNSVEWEKGSKEDFEGDYRIMDNLEVIATFDSSKHILNDVTNDISIQLYEGLSIALKRTLDGELK